MGKESSLWIGLEGRRDEQCSIVFGVASIALPQGFIYTQLYVLQLRFSRSHDLTTEGCSVVGV